MSPRKDYRIALACMAISAVVIVSSFVALFVVFGWLVAKVFAGLLIVMVLLGVACDVRRALRTTRRTRFPLSPDPKHRRVWSECELNERRMRRSGGGWRG